MNKKRLSKEISKIFILIISGIISLILFSNRYNIKELKKPYLMGTWIIYLTHLISGFIIPILFFIILSGLLFFFIGELNKRDKKLIIKIIFTLVIILLILWELIYTPIVFKRLDFIQIIFETIGIIFSFILLNSF